MLPKYKPGMIGKIDECGRYITFYIDGTKLRGNILCEFRVDKRDYWAIMTDSGNLYQIHIAGDRWWFGWVD